MAHMLCTDGNCTACENCVNVCPAEAITIDVNKCGIVVDYSKCYLGQVANACEDICIDSCPSESLSACGSICH
jgi:Fe-S-cluster-containing hydrogenase component 2